MAPMPEAHPARPKVTIKQLLAIAWRSLRSMRTALILLLMLALAAVAGSLVPQQGTSDARIAQMVLDHPLRASIYRASGLFDVYGSWWFTLIYVLLLVSLLACLFPRTRATIRNMRAKPQPARDLDTMRFYAERSVVGDPGATIDHARKVLRRRFYRVNTTNGGAPQVAADKGILREVGSLLFHWSFFLILVGVVFGKGTGFTGVATIAEGQTWTETHASYDGSIREGSFFGEAHTGVQIKVNDFAATYREDGSPESFDTSAELFHSDGTPAGEADISLNYPASIDGVKFYQVAYGFAPVITVTKDGKPLTSEPVFFTLKPPAVAGVDPNSIPWHGVVRLPTLSPQMAIDFFLWPDSRALQQFIATGDSFSMLQPHEPILLFTVYRGDLASQPVGADQLNPKALQQVDLGDATPAVAEGDTANLPDGLSISFPELRTYTKLQVSRDRGTMIMLGAALLILLGLIPALYSSRRRVWVRAEAADGGTALQVGGFALQRRTQFEQEFARLVDDLAGETGQGKREKVPSP